jgi:putative oxidoreductase
MLSFLHKLDKYESHAFALLRIIAGFTYSLHGASKLLNFPVPFQGPLDVGSQLWFAGVIELVCGLCIMLGFFGRLAAFLASGEMAVAYFQVHWPILQFQLNSQFFPIVNHGELPVLFSLIFLFVATHGTGKWSLNRH